MKKYKKPLFFILTLPFLMGNSPVPAPERTNYEDFTFSDVTCVSHNEDYSLYSSTITNTGTGYILSSDIQIQFADRYISYPDDITDKEVLAPGKSCEYTFKNSHYFTDLTDVKIEIRAFIDEIPDAVSVTGITNKSKSSYSNYDENNNPTTIYNYSLNFEYEILKDDVDLGAIYEFEYAGESHFFYSNYLSRYYSFDSKIDINVNTDLTFKSIHAFEIEKNNYDNGWSNFVFGSLFVFLLVVEFITECFPLIIAVLLGLIVVAGITVALVFIIRAIVRAKKNKNKDKKGDEQSKEDDGKNDL